MKDHFKHLSTYDKHTSCLVAISTLGDDRVASVSFETRIHVWDIKDNTLKLLLDGHKGLIGCLEYLGENMLASGSSDNTVRLWDTADTPMHSSKRQLEVLTGHTGNVGVLCNLDAELFASGSNDGTIRVWDRGGGATLHTLSGHNDKIDAMCSLGDRLLLSSGGDGSMRIWDVDAGTQVRLLTEHPNPKVTKLLYLGDGVVCMCGSGKHDDCLGVINVTQRYVDHARVMPPFRRADSSLQPPLACACPNLALPFLEGVGREATGRAVGCQGMVRFLASRRRDRGG